MVIRRAEKPPSASIMMGTRSIQPPPPLLEMLAEETRLPRFEDLPTSASTPRKPPTSSHSADSLIKQDEPSASGRSTDAHETTLPLQISKNATPSSESNSTSGESSFAKATSGELNKVVPAKHLLQRRNSRPPLLQQNSFRSLAVMQSEPLNMPEIRWFSSTWHSAEDVEQFQGSRHKTFTCGFPFPTPALPPRVQPRAHSFDENHLISGRTPLIFDRKVSQELGMSASDGASFGEQGDERSERQQAPRPRRSNSASSQSAAPPNATDIARANGAHVRHSAETQWTP